MKLEEIGFYTLSDARVAQISRVSPVWRCEILITDQCNFNCPYCQGLRADCAGTLPLDHVKRTLSLCSETGLKNVRFSGGEPTLHPNLEEIVKFARNCGAEHVALSTNGSASLATYENLIKQGVDDFSISLDACCASFGQRMCGDVPGAWERVIENIRALSEKAYVTLGMVFTQETIKDAVKIIEFGRSLGVADIRIISAAQENQPLQGLNLLNGSISDLPILQYRVNNYLNGRNVRGITQTDAHKCGLVLDDAAFAGDYHFPCIIYLREKGDPIGQIGEDMRRERFEWYTQHDSYLDSICQTNCLDICVDYNNTFRRIH
ncbi:MAG: radical SAM protein, partial [Planctomycetota bacterium]